MPPQPSKPSKPIILAIMPNGFAGLPVTIECTLSNSLPGIHVIGYANKAVSEAKDRIRSAFAASHLTLPRKLITVNLAPADLPKSDTAMDVAIAVCIMHAAGLISLEPGRYMFGGELGLDGTVRPVRGIIGSLLTARDLAIPIAFIPAENAAQASLVPGIICHAVPSLSALYAHFQGSDRLPRLQDAPVRTSHQQHLKINPPSHKKHVADFADIRGQARAKRALCIAAAGRHNILLHGPPGTGKSMLAKALVSILPTLAPHELIEVSHVHSLASHDFSKIVQERPFRSPHHSASSAAMVGGGSQPRPGEISLAHRGVLFLDELPEFNRHTIEALRQPLEDKTVCIVRSKDSAIFPADCMLVATANPCPCGMLGSQQTCRCTAAQILQYRKKISGPVMDRIDMFVQVDAVEPDQLTQAPSIQNDDATSAYKSAVTHALSRQHERFDGLRGNNSLQLTDLPAAHMSQEALQLLNTASTRLHLSSRAYVRCLRVARTIADLADTKTVLQSHMAEALQYRAAMPTP